MKEPNDQKLLLASCLKRIQKNSVEEMCQFVAECAKRVLYLRRETFDEDAVQEIVNDFFMHKLKVVCEKIVNIQISNPSGYFYKAVENFVVSRLMERQRRNLISLDDTINSFETPKDDPEAIEYIDIIPADEDELNKRFVEVLAEEYFDCFVSFCKKRRTDMFLYICFLVAQHYHQSDKFRNPTWSQANVYKIVERTRKFLKEFQEEYSIEDRVLGKILEIFYEKECSRYKNQP